MHAKHFLVHWWLQIKNTLRKSLHLSLPRSGMYILPANLWEYLFFRESFSFTDHKMECISCKWFWNIWPQFAEVAEWISIRNCLANAFHAALNEPIHRCQGGKSAERVTGVRFSRIPSVETTFWSGISRVQTIPRHTSDEILQLIVRLSWWAPSGRYRSLRWRHNGGDSVSNPQAHDYLINRFFRLRSKLTSKLCVTGLCVGNSPGTGEFPAQMASNTETVSIWWRHHVGLGVWDKVPLATFQAGAADWIF